MCMRLWDDLQAVTAGRACWVPRPERAEPWPEEAQAAFELAKRDADTMHKRLTAKPEQAA
jgi:hypothetical protein